MTVFPKRVFADVTRDLKIILDSGWALNPVTGVPIRREDHMKTEAGV